MKTRVLFSPTPMRFPSLTWAQLVFLVFFVATCLASVLAQSGTTERTHDDFVFRPTESSPRITALKRQLESGDSSALAGFWREVARTGTPSIEPMPNTPGKAIITFVFRGNSGTQSVGLLAPLGDSPGLPNLPLRRLLETDLWYASWQIRDDLRFTYRFAVNVKPGENPQQLATTDPLNPHKMEVCFEGTNAPAHQLSIASAPRAPEERWIFRKTGVPAGLLQPFDLKSAAMRSTRRIWVYTPPGYKPSATNKYGLLILFDGFSYQHWIPAPTILDNLLQAQKIPPIVAVFIDNPPTLRISDLRYSPTFVNFASDELLPWVQKRWNVTRDPQKTIIGGYSMGGAAAAFAAMRRPELFGNVLSQSGSFWEGDGDARWEFLASELEATRRLPLRFFIEAGVLENVSENGPSLLSANRHLIDILKGKGYAVTYEEVGGTHEPVHWRATFPDALVALVK